MREFRLPCGALVNKRFNEGDIAFGIVGIDEVERIHRELAYACAELGANRFGHRFRADIVGDLDCVEIFFGTRRALFLGVLPIAVAAPVAATFRAVAAVGACALPVAHAGVFALPFAFVNSVFHKHIAQLSHAQGSAFFG